MKQQISPIIVIIAIVVLVGAGIGTFMYMTTPRPPAGVKYTPGVPPWMEKNKPAASPGASAGNGSAPGNTYNPRS